MLCTVLTTGKLVTTIVGAGRVCWWHCTGKGGWQGQTHNKSRTHKVDWLQTVLSHSSLFPLHRYGPMLQDAFIAQLRNT